MQTYICLLKGINVGGNNRIKMDDLKALFHSLSLENPRTYIQSGNIAFETPHNATYLQEIIHQGIKNAFSLTIHSILRTKQEWNNIIENSPYKDIHKINHLHLTLLEDTPTKEAINEVNQINGFNDEYKILGKEFYLVCDLKYSDTKFSNTFIEKTFKTKATTRNWKTVLAIQQLF